MSVKFSGVITALATPFRQGEVDYASFKKLIAQQLENDVDGFVINGTTGESPTLSHSEVERLFEIAKLETNGQVSLLVGTGLNCTRRTIELTKAVAKWGADGALVVTPYYNKPPQRGLIDHFTAVAEATEIPIVLYNVPGRTIAAIDPETTIALARHPRIVGIKEASGDLLYLEKIKSQVRPDFCLLSGDDGTAVSFCAQGGHGVISVISHVIPAELKELLDLAKTQAQQATEKYKRFENLLKLIYVESNPIPVKAALFLMGIFETSEMRLPLVPLKEPFLNQLREEMRRLKILGK